MRVELCKRGVGFGELCSKGLRLLFRGNRAASDGQSFAELLLGLGQSGLQPLELAVTNLGNAEMLFERGRLRLGARPARLCREQALSQIEQHSLGFREGSVLGASRQVCTLHLSARGLQKVPKHNDDGTTEQAPHHQ
jgi:hypothetical protein